MTPPTSSVPPPKRPNVLVIYGPAVLLAALMIGQIWPAGFYDDDSVISLWQQQLGMWGHSLWGYCYDNFVVFLKFQGRFPLVFSFGLLPALLEIGDHLTAYRIYYGAIYLVSFLLIQSGLTRLLCSHIRATLVLLLFVSCAQFQNYHDSFTSYFAYLPLLTGFLIQAIASFDRLLDHVGETESIPTWGLVRHLVWVALAMLTWEVAIVIAVVTVGQTLLAPTALQRKWKLLLVPVAWGALFIVLNLALKQGSVNTGTVVQVSSLQSILHAYFVQLASTIPVFVGDAFTPSVWQHLPTITSSAIIGAVAITGLLMWLSRAANAEHQSLPIRKWIVSLLAGLCLIAVPPALTAITAKYQGELKWGMGYLQLHVQTFGLALILGTALIWLRGHGNKTRTVLYGLGCGLIIGLFTCNVSRNSAVVEFRNAFWKAPREITALALQQWDRSTALNNIMVERDYLQRWETPEFTFRNTGEIIPLHPRNVPAPDYAAADWFLLASPNYQPGNQSAYAYLGRLLNADCTVDNTFVVRRPPHGAPPVWLEYLVLSESGHFESYSQLVPANESGQSGPLILREPRQIKRGTLKLSVRI